jgi:hypothetical protein
MAGSQFEDVERLMDQYARRFARDLGGFLVTLGEALRGEADMPTRSQPRSAGEASRQELLEEAARLGVRGRSRMTKEQLRAAIEELRRRG